MSIDSIFVHKMWNDNELSKMVKGGVAPYAMLSDAGVWMEQYMGLVTMQRWREKTREGSSS